MALSGRVPLSWSMSGDRLPPLSHHAGWIAAPHSGAQEGVAQAGTHHAGGLQPVDDRPCTQGIARSACRACQQLHSALHLSSHPAAVGSPALASAPGSTHRALLQPEGDRRAQGYALSDRGSCADGQQPSAPGGGGQGCPVSGLALPGHSVHRTWVGQSR